MGLNTEAVWWFAAIATFMSVAVASTLVMGRRLVGDARVFATTSSAAGLTAVAASVMFFSAAATGAMFFQALGNGLVVAAPAVYWVGVRRLAGRDPGYFAGLLAGAVVVAVITTRLPEPFPTSARMLALAVACAVVGAATLDSTIRSRRGMLPIRIAAFAYAGYSTVRAGAVLLVRPEQLGVFGNVASAILGACLVAAATVGTLQLIERTPARLLASTNPIVVPAHPIPDVPSGRLEVSIIDFPLLKTGVGRERALVLQDALVAATENAAPVLAVRDGAVDLCVVDTDRRQVIGHVKRAYADVTGVRVPGDIGELSFREATVAATPPEPVDAGHAKAALVAAAAARKLRRRGGDLPFAPLS
ncbi:hypothetical protein [Microbacterium sp. P05]|uniref:hypothetical protein n=1 Tax=Microbacterium sp. P05 TaxID=3366948 RepID=UPI0037455EC0